jgi:threonine aldolase
MRRWCGCVDGAAVGRLRCRSGLAVRPIAANVAGSSRRRSFGAKIDLRSDTVTQPSAPLREAMKQSETGDDVFGEDPSTLKLERFMAFLTGKAAGLFFPSGTMANLVAAGVHCSNRGEEMILGDRSHMFLYEAGGASNFMGIAYHPLQNQSDGTICLSKVAAAVRPHDDDHCARTTLLCLENTHNKCGGTPLTSQYMEKAVSLAKDKGLKVHVDGARLLNAAIALGVQPSSLLTGCDSASICLSKGIGAPVGSVLVGNSDFIRRGRRLRKALGGGMRQSGVIASAALEAVANNFSRLRTDHNNARSLAKGLSHIDGISVVDSALRTNMVYFHVSCMEQAAFVEAMKSRGILLGAYEGGSLRAVTHLDVDAEQISFAIAAAAEVCSSAAVA